MLMFLCAVATPLLWQHSPVPPFLLLLLLLLPIVVQGSVQRRTLEVRPGRITKKLGLRYDCDCERDETKSLLGVLMLGCDILIANDE